MRPPVQRFVEEVAAITKQWRSLAESLRIASNEIERMEPAFRIADSV